MAQNKNETPTFSYSPGFLQEKFDTCRAQYTKEQKRLRLLDAADRTELWKAINAKFPEYQIMPDTNFVAYVKSNLLASLYTVTKSAEVAPTSDEDKQICMDINLILDHLWDLCEVGYYQLQAGERAALLNLGITQVGWSENLTGGSANTFHKGNIALKNIDPMQFMRDPFADSLETAGYCMTYERYHKSVLEENTLYEKRFKQYLESHKGEGPIATPSMMHEKQVGADKDYYTLITFWIKDGNKIDEVHTINGAYILYEKKDIKPSCFPFALLYCNLPAKSLIGTSEPAKVFANNVAYNLLDSLALTAEYKNQRPPKFVNTQSGLDIRGFTKYGDEANRTFVVSGDASKAVHYHQFPQLSPLMQSLKQGLQYNIESISGVDSRYTGRDTGSIITTGGTQEMLNRVTLIDAPKILLYEKYAKDLTKLILGNLVEFSPKRKYFIKDPKRPRQYKTVEVDFPSIDKETLFNYNIHISSELPKNKQRLESTANMLMEKQMQYNQQGNSVQLITEEEWLMMQDLPNKEMMLERMGLQRQTNALEEVNQVLFEYAELTKQGLDPDNAALATANSLQSRRMGQPMPEAELGMMEMMGGMGGMGGQMM